MSRRRISLPALLLLILGVALQLLAFFCLQSGAELMQYCAPAPDAQKGALIHMEALQDKVQEELGSMIDAVSVHAVKTNVNLSFGDKSVIATINAVSSRMNETCPMSIETGRWLDGNELSRGENVVVLDSDLAFALFGSEDAQGQKLELAGVPYRVIGTVRHSRGVGEVDPYGASIALHAADAQQLQMDIICLNVQADANSALRESLNELASANWGRGTLHDLRRERMSALLLTRVLLFALGMAIVLRVSLLWKKLGSRFAQQIAERRSLYYFKGWLPHALLRILVLLLLLALMLLAAYGLLSFVIEPVYSFTEWVPESLVDPKAIATVFWSRSSAGAQMIHIKSAQAARVAFWAVPARLGALGTLLGLALVFAGRRVHAKSKKLGTNLKPSLSNEHKQ